LALLDAVAELEPALEPGHERRVGLRAQNEELVWTTTAAAARRASADAPCAAIPQT
jgi:hypothetical protein